MTRTVVWVLLVLGWAADGGQARQAANAPAGVGAAAPAAGATPAMYVSFGYAGTMVLWPHRWGPITVTLIAGSKPFEGTLRVHYPQDGPLRATVVRAVACTPGKPATYQVMVNVGRGASEVVVSLHDRQDREIAKQEFGGNYSAGGGGAPFINDLSGSGQAVALGVGAKTGSARSIAYASDFARGEAAFGPSSSRCLTSDIEALSMSWTGYDSLLLLSIDAEALTRVDPRVLPAIRDWVSAGGRLVVFVDRAGAEWELIAPGDAGRGGARLFRVEEPAVAALPAELGEVLAAPVAKFANMRQWALENFGGADGALDALGDPSLAPAAPGAVAPEESTTPPTGASDSPPAPMLGASATQRIIELTDEGVAAGWRTRWAPSAGADGPATEGRARRGLLAEGPYGFGWIVVVGVDPSQVSPLGGAEGTRAVWAGIAARALADWRERGSKERASRNGAHAYYHAPSMSLPGDAALFAKSMVLDRLAAVPAIGNAIFYALVAGLIVLAVLVGPLDALVLRRLRARQHSWATCLVWITVASALAYWLPVMLRAGPTRVNRVSIVDVIMPRAGGDGSGGGGASGGHAWSMGYTGVYAAWTTRSPLGGEPGEGVGQWWRGVSAQSYSYYQPSSSSAPSNMFAQSMPDFSVLGPGAAPEATPGIGGTRLMPSVFKVWTFRLFMDQGRVSWPVGCEIQRIAGSDAEFDLRLSGLPEGARVVRAAVRAQGSWLSAVARGSDDRGDGSARAGRGSIRVGRADPARCEATWMGYSLAARSAEEAATRRSRRQGMPARSLWTNPGHAFDLPGADRRTQGVAALVDEPGESSRWAVVYLYIRGMPAGLRFDGETAYTHDTIARVLAPIDEELAGALAMPVAPVSAFVPRESPRESDAEPGEQP